MADMFDLWLDYRAKNHCLFDLVVLCCYSYDLCRGWLAGGKACPNNWFVLKASNLLHKKHAILFAVLPSLKLT